MSELQEVCLRTLLLLEYQFQHQMACGVSGGKQGFLSSIDQITHG